MKQNNANVILYTEWCPLISSLPDEKRLKLFDMILRFHEETPEISDPHLRSVFDFISLKIRENQEKYLEKCAKAKEAIAKRWEKKEEEKQDESGNESNTDVYEGIQIKENKVKQNKRKEKKIIDIKDTSIEVSKNAQPLKNSFEEAEQLFALMERRIDTQEIVDRDMIKFFEYWTAPMKSGKLFWRTQKTFAFRARLRNWMDKAGGSDKSFTSGSKKRGTAQA